MKKNGGMRGIGGYESGLFCSQILAFKHKNKQEVIKPQRKTVNWQ